MGFTNSVLDRLGFISKKVAQQNAKALIAYYSGQSAYSGTMGEWTYSKLVDGYKSWVYTSIDKIAKSIAMIPLHLFVYRRKSGKKISDPAFKSELRMAKARGELKYFMKEANVVREQIFDHPFLTLITHPNPIMTRFTLWYETLIRLELGGSCGWYMPTNGLKLPGQIWPLPLTKTAILTPVVSPKMEVESWKYQDGTVQEIFLPIEVILHKYPNPAHPLKGMSPLMAQQYPYEIDRYLMVQQKALFENMAVTGYNLTTEQKLNMDQVKEIREYLDEEYAGASKAGKGMVLHSGLKSDRMGMTGRESMIDKVEKFARDKLITSFDMSPGKLGLVEDVNRANMEALNATFVNECQRPKCMMLEENLETFLLPRYDEGLTCDFDLPDVTDREIKLKERESNLSNLVTTINEERLNMGKDEVPWGDVPFVPFSLAPWGTEPSKPTPVGGGDGDDGDGKVLKKLDRNFWTDAKKAQRWNTFVRRSEKFEPIFLVPMRAYFKKIAGDVASRLQAEGHKVTSNYAGWSRQRVVEALKEDARVRAINIDRVREAAILRDIFRPYHSFVLQVEGSERIRELRNLKVSIEFNLGDPRAKRWLGSRLRKFSEEVTGTTFDEISDILREGFAAGEPVTTIAQTLRDKFESWDKYRANGIARTESLSALNQADLQAVGQAGLDKVFLKHWLSARDGACRETHVEADKQYSEDGIEMDEDFKVGEDSMACPGNGTKAEENINCRCAMFYTEKD